jgi:hypothetical protein
MSSYREAWRRYRRWNRLAVALLLGMFPLFAVLSTMFSSELGFLTVVAPVMGFYGAIWIGVSLYVAHWRCPRCEEPFFRRGLSLRPRMFIRQCQHCALPTYAASDTSHAASRLAAADEREI